MISERPLGGTVPRPTEARSRRPGALRLSVCLALAAVGAGALSAQSQAASVEKDGEFHSTIVTYSAGPGETNRLAIRVEADGIRFTDNGATITSSSCTSVTPNEVFCAGTTDTISAGTGDGSDLVDASTAPSARVDGGPGNDVIRAAIAAGGEGNDDLRGIEGPGQLRGGPGVDTLIAGQSGYELYGGPGNDTLVGGDGRDSIWGGEGPCATCPIPSEDDDIVRGGRGDDILYVEEGADRIDGEAGSDSYVVNPKARRLASVISDTGDSGLDRINLGCAGVRFDAPGGTTGGKGRLTVSGGFVTFSGIENAPTCKTSRKAVPRVVGMTLARARRTLVASGFRLGSIRVQHSRSVRRGNVISQKPSARPPTTAAAGSAVSLVVSAGP